MKLCPYKFGYYEFEGGQECDGLKCGMFKRCANNSSATQDDFYFRMADVLAKSGHEFKMRDISADEARKITGWDEVPEAQQQDSREKLEADVLKYYTHTTSTLMWPDDANIKTKWVSVSMYTVLEWLDRQAAITEAEQREWWGGVVAELQANVDELTEQRDRWRSNWTERNIAYSELADECQELEAKVDELTELQAKVDVLEIENSELCDEIGALNELRGELTRERDEYRKLLGVVLERVDDDGSPS